MRNFPVHTFNRRGVALLGALIALSAASCGSDPASDAQATQRGRTEDEDAPTASTSPLDTKRVSDLDAAESATLCEWLFTLWDDPFTEEQYCTHHAAADAATPEECMAMRDGCLEGRHGASHAPGREDCTKYRTPHGCPVTVRALKRCYADLAEGYVEEVRRSSCTEPLQQSEFPASCGELPTECFGEDDTAGVSDPDPA